MVRGKCLCGGVQFEATQVPLIVLCHCSICRKANGASFEAAASVPSADFRFTRDGKIYSVPAGLLDHDPGVKPALHIFVGSKAPWWEITDDLPQFEKWVPGYGPDEQ